MGRKAVFELLKEVNETKKKDLPGALLAALQQYPRLADILYYGLSENGKWALPEGEPPFKPADPVNTHTLLWSEARKLYLFHPAKEMKETKRQELFIQTLEFIHPDDTNLLLVIKDGKWPYTNITAKVMSDLAPGFLDQKVRPDGSRG